MNSLKLDITSGDAQKHSIINTSLRIIQRKTRCLIIASLRLALVFINNSLPADCFNLSVTEYKENRFMTVTSEKCVSFKIE